MKKILTNFVILLFLIVFSASCIYKKKQFAYKVFIEDVECPVCAQTAVQALEKIEGVSGVRFYDNEGDYESGYACLEADSQILEKEIIKKTLQEEGFDLKEFTILSN